MIKSLLKKLIYKLQTYFLLDKNEKLTFMISTDDGQLTYLAQVS